MTTSVSEFTSTSTATYTRVAVILHWLIAFLIVGSLIGSLIFGPLLDSADPSERAKGGAMVGMHQSVGLTILALTIFRLIWRLANPAPPLPRTMNSPQRTLARVSHFAFYALILAVPAAGYIMSSASPYPIIYFGLFEVPKLAIGSDVGELAHGAHYYLAIYIVALLVLHIAAALKHHFVDRDEVLSRMVPFVRRKKA